MSTTGEVPSKKPVVSCRGMSGRLCLACHSSTAALISSPEWSATLIISIVVRSPQQKLLRRCLDTASFLIHDTMDGPTACLNQGGDLELFQGNRQGFQGDCWEHVESPGPAIEPSPLALWASLCPSSARHHSDPHRIPENTPLPETCYESPVVSRSIPVCPFHSEDSFLQDSYAKRVPTQVHTSKAMALSQPLRQEAHQWFM